MHSYQQAFELLESVFKKVSALEASEKLEFLKNEFSNQLLLPNQLLYLLSYNPRKIFYARNVSLFWDISDNELTMDYIVEHISPSDVTFVSEAIQQLYEWCHLHPLKPGESVFTVEYRIVDRDKKDIIVQRNSILLDYDQNFYPLLAVSVVTNITPMVQGEFLPRATLVNPYTNEQYFFSQSQGKSNIAFTTREKEVLELLCKGMNSKAIAEMLFISKHTVDGHRRILLEKTNSKSTPELICSAIKNKWVVLH